jgi:16S rRNA (cytosine1402-N4)-methyltransferase
MQEFVHKSVLLHEAVDALAVRSGGRYIDGTFGRGGHSREIVSRGGLVLGIDRDDEAIAAAKAENFNVVKNRHGNLKEVSVANGWSQVDGILLDLGVSSPQLDEAFRGFSFMRDGPLDMRMDVSDSLTAADIVNEESEENLAAIFREFGQEPNAGRIARAIVKERKLKGCYFDSTLKLADFVERLLGRRGAHHPATRIFQALRMAVNDEIGELERALEGGIELLAPGGRFAVITFESLTDRIVKRFFASHVGKMRSLQAGGEVWQGVEPRVRPVTKKPITASEEEIKFNPRSRSAKLRAIEKELDR